MFDTSEFCSFGGAFLLSVVEFSIGVTSLVSESVRSITEDRFVITRLKKKVGRIKGEKENRSANALAE